jgi:hypothetical protein
MILPVLAYISFLTFFLFGMYNVQVYFNDYSMKMSLNNYDLPPASFPKVFPHTEILPELLLDIKSHYKVNGLIGDLREGFVPLYFRSIPLAGNNHLPFVIVCDPTLTFGVDDRHDPEVKYNMFINGKKVYEDEGLKKCIVAYWAVKKSSRGQLLYSDEFWISADDCTSEELRMSQVNRNFNGEEIAWAPVNHIVIRHAYNNYFNSIYNFLEKRA